MRYSPERAIGTPSEGKPLIIGLYGVSGSGKSHLLQELRQQLGENYLEFYEGSEMIDQVAPGGLDEFKNLGEDMKLRHREEAIRMIQRNSLKTRKAAIVTGHLMLWSEQSQSTTAIYTEADLDIFTHILYLDTPAEIVEQRHRSDFKRQDRAVTSTSWTRRWQEDEKNQLRLLCYQHGILFMRISGETATLAEQASNLLWNFLSHNEMGNLMRATEKLDSFFRPNWRRIDTMLVIDGDKTLSTVDTGTLFWKKNYPEGHDPLKTLFGSPMGYSYTAFRQAALLYEEIPDHNFNELCKSVASSVSVRAEFMSLLEKVAKQDRVGAVVVTCGLQRVWEIILRQAGLFEKIKVIGGGSLADKAVCVVTASLKAALVTYLQQTHKVYVWAFGDSVVDLEMLLWADEAIVVVDDTLGRSTTMGPALNEAIERKGLRARQVLLPSNSTPWLDVAKLPIVNFPESEILHARRGWLDVIHATEKNASKLLATQSRDANVAGPSLRGVHRSIGWYLGTEYVTAVVGLQSYETPHVQGGTATGYRLFEERQTTIVALMRGGEPMAQGVSEVFPLAMFVHAKAANDLTEHHVLGQRTIVLVDSVVNHGKSILDFTERIRSLHRSIHIVVVTGVVQAQAIRDESPLVQAFENNGKRTLIALRVSNNKYTGTGHTDTGNRLFNTTHLG